MKELEPKYFLYARKSTEDDDHQIMSIEAQLFELREYARRENLHILAEYTESKSAKKPGRELFGAMMTRFENGEANGILAWHPDRLARNSVDGGRIIYLVDTDTIASLRFPTFWFEPTPQGKFMLQVAFGQSKYYSDNFVENINRGIRQKLRRGEWLTRASFGYVNNFKTRTIEPHPTRSRVIVRAYKEYAKGTHTLESLAELLAEHGITTKQGTPLGKASVVRILTNRAYLGFVKHKDEWHDGSFRPILSPTLFEAVQKVLASRRKPRRANVARDFPFLQFMRCGECGGTVTAQNSINRFGTLYHYYHCTFKSRTQKCSQTRFLREEELAKQVQAMCQKVSLPDEWRDKYIARLESEQAESRHPSDLFVQNLKNDISATSARLERLTDAYLAEALELGEYLERKNALMSEKKTLEEKLGDFECKGNHWLELMRN